MKTFVVETSINVAGDGLRSFQEAWRQATAWSVANGEKATIAFVEATSVSLTGTMKLRAGADVVIDGRIKGDMTFETGANDVRFVGAASAGYDPQSTGGYGFTMFDIAAGGTLKMVDVALTGHLHVGATGASGASGTDGVNGTDGGEGLPGAPGNGGQSVGTTGKDGKMAVGGIRNAGDLVLDRVNFNNVGAFGGNGGPGGNGGNGGDGGDGGEAPPSGGTAGIGGSGGNGGSGTGRGGDGAIAAGGVLNLGSLTLIDTWFQNTYVSGGQGGKGGSGGSGGDGGSGSWGGTGGNGGFAGNGGNGASGAATVYNLGTMLVQGAWANGSNTVFGGSGLGGAGGTGGQGGGGGEGAAPEDNGFNGVDRFNGGAGSTAVSAEALFATKGFASSTFYIETVADSFAEYDGGFGGVTITAAIYRLGATTAPASVSLSLTGLGGATGAGVQGGLFAGQVVGFSQGQTVAVVTLFTALDGVGADARYRLTLSQPDGAQMGGNRTATFTIENREIHGSAGDDLLRGTGQASVLRGGLGNDTLVAGPSDDLLDGEGGQDWLVLNRVVAGPQGQGALADLAAFAVSGAGIGTNSVLNVENVQGSQFADTLRGDFGANTLIGAGGADLIDGGFNDDLLIGRVGRDTLIGGAGNDTLIGGVGRDVLTGGNGADHFVFDTGPRVTLAGHADRITDFTSGEDTIVLVRTGAGPFDALAFGALAPGRFRIGAEATTAQHRIIHDTADGRVYYDPDGVGGIAQVEFARLDGAVTLAASDFLVI